MNKINNRYQNSFPQKFLSIGRAAILTVVIGAVGICITGCGGGFVGNCSPAWSPDGMKIAFHSNRDGDYEIYVMGDNGSQQINLTNNHYWSWNHSPNDHYPSSDASPSWSPDSAKIAFISYRLHDGKIGDAIYVMDADGGNQSCLLEPPVGGGFNRTPAWSPDGSKCDVLQQLCHQFLYYTDILYNMDTKKLNIHSKLGGYHGG